MNLKHRKEDIVVKGEEIFRENGYHSTGVSEILNRCKISKGTFYNYFKSKEDFAVKVIDYYGDVMFKFIEKSLTQPNFSPLEKLKLLYTILIDLNFKEDCRKGCLIYNLSYELAGQNLYIAEVLDQHLESWLQIIATCVEEGQAKNEITKVIPAYQIASTLHTTYNGASGRIKAQRSIHPMKEVMDTVFKMIES